MAVPRASWTKASVDHVRPGVSVFKIAVAEIRAAEFKIAVIGIRVAESRTIGALMGGRKPGDKDC